MHDKIYATVVWWCKILLAKTKSMDGEGMNWLTSGLAGAMMP